MQQRLNSRSVKKPNGRSSVAVDGVESMEVDFVTIAAVKVADLESEESRTEEHVLEGAQTDVVNFTLHWHDRLVAVLVDGLADHPSGVVLWVSLHPSGSEGL